MTSVELNQVGVQRAVLCLTTVLLLLRQFTVVLLLPPDRKTIQKTETKGTVQCSSSSSSESALIRTQPALLSAVASQQLSACWTPDGWIEHEYHCRGNLCLYYLQVEANLEALQQQRKQQLAPSRLYLPVPWQPVVYEQPVTMYKAS